MVPEWVDPADRMAVMLLEQHRRRYQAVCDDVAGKRVLDLGCGSGYGARMLAAAGAAQVLAVDRDPAALAFARRHYDHRAIEYVESTVADLRVDDVDVVTCFEVLEHVPDAQGCLSLVRRALNQDGTLYLSGCVYPTMDIYGYHLRDYDEATLRREVEDAGFHIEDELKQSAAMTATDVRRASRMHLRSFPTRRFVQHPLRVLRRLVQTQLLHGVVHEDLMLVARPVAPT